MKTKISYALASLFFLITTIFIFTGCTQPGGKPSVTLDIPDNISATVGTAVTINGSATIPDGITLAYAWIFNSVPTGSALINTDITGADTLTPSFTPDIAGDYKLDLTASYLEYTWTKQVTVTAAVSNSDASETAYQEALNLLFQTESEPDMDAALSALSSAIVFDPTNEEAQAFYSLLYIIDIVTDPALAELAGKLKITEYPSSITEAFFTDGDDEGAWFTMNVCKSSWQEWDEESQQYVTVYNFSPFPEIEIPSGINALDGTTEMVSPFEYYLALLYNFITAYPANQDDFVDMVIDDLLTGRLDHAIDALNAISDNIAITVPTSNINGMEYDIVVGKAEMLAVVAGLKSLKASLISVQMVSYNFPMLQIWNLIDPPTSSSFNWGTFLADADGDLQDFLDFLIGNPVLEPRDDPDTTEVEYELIKDEIETLMKDSLSDMNEAMNMVLDDREGFYLSSSCPDTNFRTNIWPNMKIALTFENVVSDKMTDSIDNDNTFIMPVDIYNYIVVHDEYNEVDAIAFMEHYIANDAANWPTTAYYGDLSGSVPPTAIGLNMNALFTDGAALIELVESGDRQGEPELYKFSVDLIDPADMQTMMQSGAPGAFLEGITMAFDTPVSSMIADDAQDELSLYAFKVLDLTLNGFLDINETTINDLKADLAAMLNAMMMIDTDGDYTPDANVLDIILAGGFTFNGSTPTDLVAQILDSLLVYNEDDSVSLLLPAAPAILAYNSFADAGDTVNVSLDDYIPVIMADYNADPIVPADPIEFDFVTTGSFWTGPTKNMINLITLMMSIMP